MYPPSSPLASLSVRHSLTPPTKYLAKTAQASSSYYFCTAIPSATSLVKFVFYGRTIETTFSLMDLVRSSTYPYVPSNLTLLLQVFLCRLEVVNSLGVCPFYPPPFPQQLSIASPIVLDPMGALIVRPPFSTNHSAADAGIVIVVDHHWRSDLMGRDYIPTV